MSFKFNSSNILLDKATRCIFTLCKHIKIIGVKNSTIIALARVAASGRWWTVSITNYVTRKVTHCHTIANGCRWLNKKGT